MLSLVRLAVVLKLARAGSARHNPGLWLLPPVLCVALSPPLWRWAVEDGQPEWQRVAGGPRPAGTASVKTFRVPVGATPGLVAPKRLLPLRAGRVPATG